MLDASAALLDRGGLLHTFDGDRATVDYVLKTAIELIRTDVQRLASALHERNAQAVVEAAHRIKGTSVELRANRLQDLSARLERTADDDFWDIAPQLLADLNSAVKALCREIETSAA
jgi:HPt (histidine-containing phosphotransfer) domain-containing protein